MPTIEAVVPDASQPVAQLGTTIGLTGHHLDGTGREVVLVNDRFEIEETLPALAGGGETSMHVLDSRWRGRPTFRSGSTGSARACCGPARTRRGKPIAWR